tara:strand:+ start:1811 stop:2338 length:528 start_codon:yes stop_codon:yes gene_type:complete
MRLSLRKTYKQLGKIGKLVIKGLQEELDFQKHNASTALSKSFKVQLNERKGELNIITNKLYWRVVNDKNVAYKVSLRAIENWVRNKGGKGGFPRDNEGIKSVAIRVYNKLKNKFYGKPYVYWTEGNNLRRTDFAGYTAKKYKSKIAKELAPAIGDDVANMIRKQIRKIKPTAQIS